MGSLRFGRPVRWRSRRRPLARWAFTAALAILAGAMAAGAVGRAEAARAAYGAARTVPVARHDLAAGAVVAEADVEWRELPVAVVPPDVADDPVGRTVRQPVLAGEVVAGARLAGEGSGPLALLDRGSRAVAVPVDGAVPQLRVGDRVDVMAPETPGAASSARSAGARRVARAAAVLAVDDDAVTLAVAATDVPALARAVLDGTVALALVGPAG